MSREVRRVALDFDWPIGEIWSGYLMPEALRLPQCPACEGSGWGPMARQLNESFYALGYHGAERQRMQWNNKITDEEVELLANEGRLHQWRLRMWVKSDPPEIDEDGHPKGSWIRTERPMPTATEVNAAEDHNFVHDAINRGILVQHRCRQRGHDPECLLCKGTGNVGTEEQRAAEKVWKQTEPPAGEGWQLWETTTEGSPKSPVFATGEELAQWMSQNPCGFAGSRISLQVAREWVHESGWSPSMIVTDKGGIMDGITATVVLKNQP